MAKKTDTYQILLVTKDIFIQEEVETNIAELNGFSIASVEEYPDNLNSAIQLYKPDLMLLDCKFMGDEILDYIDSLALSHPQIPIVVIMTPDNIQNSNSVMLSGARAFITTPIETANLEKVLNRVIELSSRYLSNTEPKRNLPVSDKKQSGETLVVFSPKGGVGCTSVAANLAIAMKKHYDEVLLLDGKFLFGHISLALNIRTANSIIDLVSHAGNLDEGLIRQVTVPHPSGIDVLPAPNALSEGQGIRVEEIFSVIKSLQKIYDIIIIDSGNYLDENTVTMMDSASYILLVMTPEIASLRDTRKFLDIARNLGYPKTKMKLILNKAGRRSEMHSDEIEKIIKNPLICTIPTDQTNMPASMNDGVPIILKKPRHEISKKIVNLSKKLSDLPKVILESSANDNALDQSSKFG